jgi:hypothetical protein
MIACGVKDDLITRINVRPFANVFSAPHGDIPNADVPIPTHSVKKEKFVVSPASIVSSVLHALLQLLPSPVK